MSLPVQFVQDVWVRKTFSSAGYSLLVYDYLLTLQDEVTYIWKAPWTFVKVMFLINRYGILLGQTFVLLEEAGVLTNNSQEFCENFALISTIFMLLSSESIHILVLLRAWAIWGTRKRVAKILICCYVLYCLVQLGGAMWTVNKAHLSYFRYLDSVKVCVGSMPNYVWLSYFGSFILDTVLFVLTMKSLRKYSRESHDLYPSGLVHVLVRDAILFFVVGIFSNALTIVSWTAFKSSPKYLLGKGFANPLLSVAGQRLVLNLKGLKTHTYATHDLSLEVDRQLAAAFNETDNPIVLENGDSEIGRESSEK